MLNTKTKMLNNSINKLTLQKKIVSSQLENLINKIIEKDKIIENLKDKIHH